MKVCWTHHAITQLDAVYAHIALDSENYARRMVDQITGKTQLIAAFPFSGRKVHEYDMEQIREVIEGPYRIIYYIKPEQIDILAVVHCAMNVLRP